MLKSHHLNRVDIVYAPANGQLIRNTLNVTNPKMTSKLMKTLLLSLVVFSLCHFTEAILNENTTENVCERNETYTEMVPITETQVYMEETKKFCWSLKKRFSCPKMVEKTRERVVLKAMNRTRIIRECCPGFSEVDGKCVIDPNTQITKEDKLKVSSATQFDPANETVIGGVNTSLDLKNNSTEKPGNEDGIKNYALLPEISKKNTTLSQSKDDTEIKNSSQEKDSEKISVGKDNNTSSLASKSEKVSIPDKFAESKKSENASSTPSEAAKKSPVTVLPTLEHTVTVLPINTIISKKDEQSVTQRTELPLNSDIIQSQKENGIAINNAQTTPKKETNKNVATGDGNKESSPAIVPTKELSESVAEKSESENKKSDNGIQALGKESVQNDTIVRLDKETSATAPKNATAQNAATVLPDKILTPTPSIKENIAETVENSGNKDFEKNKENGEKTENVEAENSEKSGDKENVEGKENREIAETDNASKEPVKHELESKIAQVVTNKSEENGGTEDHIDDNASKLENNDRITLIWFLSAAAIIALITVSLAYALRHFQVSKKYNVEPSRSWVPNHIQDDSKNYFFKV